MCNHFYVIQTITRVPAQFGLHIQNQRNKNTIDPSVEDLVKTSLLSLCMGQLSTNLADAKCQVLLAHSALFLRGSNVPTPMKSLMEFTHKGQGRGTNFKNFISL